MLKASSCKHGPAHFFILFLVKSYCYLCKSLFLGFPCSHKPVKMAGAGYGVTPMSRLSQHSSRRRHRSPQTGKPLDLSSPNIAATPTRKKTPKRKTLSSRYTAASPSKRRKLGINSISDPINLASTAVSPEACHSTENNQKERESKHLGTKGRARKARAKAKARARAKARLRANIVQGDLIAEASKLLGSKASAAHSPVGVSDVKPKLLTLNENTRVGYEGNHNGDSSPSTIEKVNLKARLPTLDSNLVGPLLSDRIGDLEKHDTDRQVQASKREFARKSSSKRFPNSSFEQRTERDHDAAQLSGAASPSLLSESQAPGSLLEDSIDGSPHSRQDSCLLEGRFLRPRRQARKKSKSDEHRLPPWEYVGKRVVVYWPHAKAWYAGKVIKYDDSSKKHKIKYDDSDEECISFRRHKVVLEKSPSTQSGNCPVSAKEAGRASASHHHVDKDVTTDVEPCKSVKLQPDFVEDNALLSAFAPRQRFREASREPLCNGSVKPVKSVDSTPGKDSQVQKTSKTKMSSFAKENTERTGAEDKVYASAARGGEAALVYVRRTKSRRKVDVSSMDLAASGRVNDYDGLSGALQQERPRKRKKSHPLVQQTAQVVSSMDLAASGTVNDSDSLSGALQQERPRKRKRSQPLVQQTAPVDFLHGRYSDTLLNSPVAPDVCDENGGGGSASEQSLPKRNKRSLMKLVSQVSVMQGTEVAQELDTHCDRKRKRASKRAGRKLRKHKLASLVSSSRDRRLPTERASDDAEGLMYASLGHDVIELHDSEMLAIVQESHNSFFHTIHLVLPVVTPDLFTWQLFSILARVNFCEGSSFDERFSLKGSLEDWKSIFRIASGIVKAVPLSDWINGRQWQCRILHELWNVMPRCGPALTDMFAFLPAEAENIIVEHLRGAILSCMMTSRQILNLFVCCFIKPYILATVCDKGASFKVVVQQILMLDRSKEGTTCLRQSVKSFPLQSSPDSADLDFSSYLMLFARPTDWCTEEGLFLKQMEGWIETAASGNAEKWVPVLTIKKSNYLGWQITSAHLVNHGYAIDEIESKVFRLEQGAAKLGISNNFNAHCSRHAESGVSGFNQNDGLSFGFRNCHCLNSALLYTSFLQRSLSEAVGTGVCSSPTTKYLLLNKVPGEEEQSIQLASVKLVGVKEESELGSMVVPNSDAVTKHVKNEPEMIFSRRNSSITTESNGAAIKEESSVEMYGRQLILGQLNNGFPLKSDEQHFSGQIDQEYYGHKRFKDMRKVKKSRPRHRSEWRNSVREEPSTFCCADLLFPDGDVVVRERDVKVEVRPNGKIDFMVVVHLDGTEVFAQRVKQVSTLGENPPELRWRSGNRWVIDFPDREQWELFRGIYNELCIRTVEGGSSAKDIPVPVVKGLEGPDGATLLGSSIRPFFAIKYPDDEIAVAYRTGRILYDLDSEDEAWMNEFNRESGNEISDKSLVISDDALEQMIDRLEKEAHMKGDESVAVHDAIQVCQDLGVADILRAVHAYWSNKRLVKGKSLLRYFQPPLWEQYQDELRIWEARMEQCPPNAQNMLLERFPRPVMSAFCLQSRTLDALDMSKRMLRQRSQRKIRPPSRSSSEDSHRLSAYRHTDSAWHLIDHSQYAKPSTQLAIGLHPYALRDRIHKQDEQEESEEVKAARTTAVEARKLATVRATKLQRRFLEFDSSLQKAWALLIEYEAVAGDEASAQSEALEGRMALLFSQCSSLLSKGDDSCEDEPPSHAGRVCKDVGQEFLDAFERKCSLDGKAVVCERVGDLDLGGDGMVEEALLPISVEASSYAWNGSSLL